jgi:ABC-type nitrate/sulfonate/bicarbonate transport system permease component
MLRPERWRAAVIPLLLLAALELVHAQQPPPAATRWRRPARRCRPGGVRCATGRCGQATAFTLGTAATGLALGAAWACWLGTLLGLSRRAAAGAS